MLAIFGIFLLFDKAYSKPVELLNSDQSITQLTSTAEKIVTLSPHLTEMVFAAGAGDKIIAVVDWSDYPPAAQSLPRIGDAFRVDMELLLKLNPDLVIAWQSGNSAATLDKIAALGIPVWKTELGQLHEVAELILNIGIAAGTETEAVIAANEFTGKIKQLQNEYNDSPTFRYFMQLYPQPLYTVNSQHLISQGLKLCQGKNVFANLSMLAPTVSQEAVIATQPDTIFYTQSDTSAAPNDPVNQWIPWLGSSKKPELLALNPDLISRPGPRIIDGIRQACEAQNTRLENSL